MITRKYGRRTEFTSKKLRDALQASGASDAISSHQLLKKTGVQCQIMDLASPPRRVSPARADMAEDLGDAVVSTVSPKRPATAKPATEVEAADAADDVPTGGLQTKMVDQNRISVAHLRGTGGAEFEGKAA